MKNETEKTNPEGKLENTQQLCDECNGFTDSGEVPKDEIAPDNWCICGVAK